MLQNQRFLDTWYDHVPNVNKANTILAVCRIMIDQIHSGRLDNKHLIQNLYCIIALIKGFVLALNYEIPLSKLNSSKHIKVSKLTICYVSLLQWSVLK